MLWTFCHNPVTQFISSIYKIYFLWYRCSWNSFIKLVWLWCVFLPIPLIFRFSTSLCFRYISYKMQIFEFLYHPNVLFSPRKFSAFTQIMITDTDSLVFFFLFITFFHYFIVCVFFFSFHVALKTIGLYFISLVLFWFSFVLFIFLWEFLYSIYIFLNCIHI